MVIVAKSPSSLLLNPAFSPRSSLDIDFESGCSSLFHLIGCFQSTSPGGKLRALKVSRNRHPSIPVLVSPTVVFRNCPSRKKVIALCCSSDDTSSSRSSADLVQNKNESITGGEVEELELRGKPSPKPVERVNEEDAPERGKLDKDEILAPFLKFFKSGESSAAGEEEEIEEQQRRYGRREESGGGMERERESNRLIEVEYYEPKPGDFVVGMVVYGNESKLDVNVGADVLGTMLSKEVLPLYDKEMDYLACDLDKDAEEYTNNNGKIGLIRYKEAFEHHPAAAGRPILEAGTVLFAEVLGRTLSGRPLLSSRRLFRRIAWLRVRQIQQLNEPIQVQITEWNTGGLLTRIEGLRAFLPKAELTTRVNNFTELKANVGRQMRVQITRIDEETNDLIISEREAWENVHLREGALVEGTVARIFSYGAQIRLGETSRSGLLHMSNISRGKVTSVADLLSVDEKVKVLVLKSLLPNRISLSIAELESEPGLFIKHKQRVFSEAEEMAAKYRQNMPAADSKKHGDGTPIFWNQDESSLYANWKWFKFQGED